MGEEDDLVWCDLGGLLGELLHGGLISYRACAADSAHEALSYVEEHFVAVSSEYFDGAAHAVDDVSACSARV